MTEKEQDLQKLIEAAEKSVQEGKEFRTAALTGNIFTEKEAEEQKQEETKSEWNEWGRQISERIDDENAGDKTLKSILSTAAIILALIVISVFIISISKQQKILSSKPRLNINSITDKNNLSTSSSALSDESSEQTGGIAVHNKVPSSQAPSWYKPLERDKTTGKIIRRTPTPPAEPDVIPSLTPETSPDVVKPAKTGEKQIAEPGTESSEYQSSWMKESPPPKTTPQGEPILIH